MPQELMRELRARAREFFSLSREVKARYGIEAAYDSGWLEMHPAGGVRSSTSPARSRMPRLPICMSRSTWAPASGPGMPFSTGCTTRPTTGPRSVPR
ncbi:hypothetical protein DNK48_18300 [Streptomyces malaysiensis subsp. malaysiensis]|nr:hypothetical protein DNK48_18300 [Streptomyces malaysiensis]